MQADSEDSSAAFEILLGVELLKAAGLPLIGTAIANEKSATSKAPVPLLELKTVSLNFTVIVLLSDAIVVPDIMVGAELSYVHSKISEA